MLRNAGFQKAVANQKVCDGRKSKAYGVAKNNAIKKGFGWMTLEKIGAEIIAEAEKNASAIAMEGKKEAERIMLEAKEKAKEISEKLDSETGKILEEIRQVELSGFSLALNKEVLEAKKEVFSEIFQEAKKRIAELDKKKRSEIVLALCRKGLSEIPQAKFVYCNAEDKKTVLQAKGLVFKKEISCSGGVIIENADATIKANYLFEEILAKVWEENLHGIANRVFGKS
ncbi:MAG: V-type ATP synthase subunit E family protein [Candidatus ainarchaeum sp.]|nr:V-type ATP synthase subunit E family protein [Candidatus ainarchaeum sp.]